MTKTNDGKVISDRYSHSAEVPQFPTANCFATLGLMSSFLSDALARKPFEEMRSD